MIMGPLAEAFFGFFIFYFLNSDTHTTHTQVRIEFKTSHTEESLYMGIYHWDVPEGA